MSAAAASSQNPFSAPEADTALVRDGSEDGEDGEDGTPVVGRRGKSIKTIGEAVLHTEDLMEIQVQRADDEGARANEPVGGDAAARITFYTLLPYDRQRAVFRRMASDMRVWPRLRSLFGAPPYGFLRSEDAGMLRAAGIASGRANMAHDTAQAAASYTQFGAGHLIDQLGREYRVVRVGAADDNDPLPCDFSVRDAPDVFLNVRLKRRKRSQRMEMMRDTTQREALAFPRVGQRITLKETRRILLLQGLQPNRPTLTTLQVKRVIPRGLAASTAALVANIV